MVHFLSELPNYLTWIEVVHFTSYIPIYQHISSRLSAFTSFVRTTLSGLPLDFSILFCTEGIFVIAFKDEVKNGEASLACLFVFFCLRLAKKKKMGETCFVCPPEIAFPSFDNLTRALTGRAWNRTDRQTRG